MKNNNRLWISCGIIALVGCLCISVAGLGGAGYIFNRQVIKTDAPVTEIPDLTRETFTPTPELSQPTGSVETEAPLATEPAQTEAATATETTGNQTEEDLPPDVARQMNEIEKQVVELRGLQSTGPVDRALLTPDELHEYVVNDFLGDYTAEEARDDALSLAAFGLLEPDFDLHGFYIELFGEQVAGFYDDEVKAMYVIQDQGFKGPQRLTYAHEYVHALQDQTYDIEEGLNYNDEACELDSERCAAVQALIEGDASMTELEWFTTFATQQDITDIQQFYSNYSSPIYDQAPAFMQQDFIFPYTGGQAFVEHLRSQGGWQAVNEAYKNLPVSTEQILHPEKYPSDKPLPVDLPELDGLLGEGWAEIDRGVMGEWYTQLILGYGYDAAAQLEGTEAAQAAEGWGGDAYAVYYHEGSGYTVMVLKYVWESNGEAQEYAASFLEYANSRFSPGASTDNGRRTWAATDGFHIFQQNGTQTLWVLAPDQALAEKVFDAVD